MFVTPAHAATQAGAQGGSARFFIDFAVPMLLIFVIFYFFMIRPQQRRMKEHQAKLASVKRNDTIVTTGGLIGKVTKVDDTEVEVELAQNVRVRVLKAMVAEIRQPGAKPAND